MEDEKNVAQEEETTSTDSPTETKQEEATQSDEGEDTQTKKPLAFHEDPKVQDYINRQLEAREKKLRDDFEARFKPEPKKEENSEIPEWFGGDVKQWKAYQADQARIVSEAEERAFTRLSETQKKEHQAVQDANKYFEDSISSIETEFATKVDRNKLLKFVLDNELIDSQGRWNYKKGYEFMTAKERADAIAKGEKSLKDRKQLADATTKDGGSSEGEKKNYKTSEDFRKERPW